MDADCFKMFSGDMLLPLRAPSDQLSFIGSRQVEHFSYGLL